MRGLRRVLSLDLARSSGFLTDRTQVGPPRVVPPVAARFSSQLLLSIPTKRFNCAAFVNCDLRCGFLND